MGPFHSYIPATNRCQSDEIIPFQPIAGALMSTCLHELRYWYLHVASFRSDCADACSRDHPSSTICCKGVKRSRNEKEYVSKSGFKGRNAANICTILMGSENWMRRATTPSAALNCVMGTYHAPCTIPLHLSPQSVIPVLLASYACAYASWRCKRTVTNRRSYTTASTCAFLMHVKIVHTMPKQTRSSE